MRLFLIFGFGILSAVVGSAGPIQIGGSAGLTSSYISTGCAGAGPCVSGSAGSFVQSNFDVRLFQSTAGSIIPFAGYNQSSAVTSGTLGPSGQFAMIEGNMVGSNSANFWDAAGTTAIDVPIGLSGVNDVSLMLNDIWGVAGASETVVTFDFANSSNGSTVDQVVVDLQNSGAAGSSASGQIRSSVDCASPCSYGGNTYASGPLAATSAPMALLNGSTPIAVAVTTSNVFSTAYTGTNILGVSKYTGSSGTISLDAQDFQLGSFSNLYLTQILVQDPSAAAFVSQTALSAITVDVVAPEPSTIGLLFAGFSVFAFGFVRRRSSRLL